MAIDPQRQKPFRYSTASIRKILQNRFSSNSSQGTQLPSNIVHYPPEEQFQHVPLNLESPSIRLIRIHATQNSDGMISCEIQQASMDSTYTCLSYVWGSAGKGQWILVDGRKFWVRRNLWDFLNAARKPSGLSCRWLWIDALCIDQTNVNERQHQVRQMGSIYANATEVVSWLGCREPILKFLGEVSSSSCWSPNNMWAFSHSPYWGRAWITQEIVLARRLKLMAGNHLVGIEALPELPTMASDALLRYQVLVDRISYLRHRSQQPGSHGNRLIPLLDEFRFQQCSISRDRIFSLLAMCSDGATLKVDYVIPDAELALQVLQCCEPSFCLCSIQIVGDVLVNDRFETKSDLEASIGPKAWGILTVPVTWSDEDYLESWEHYDAWSYNKDWSDVCSQVSPSRVVIHRSSMSASDRSTIHIGIDLGSLCTTYTGRVIIWLDQDSDEIRYLGYDTVQNTCRWEKLSTRDIIVQMHDDGSYCTLRMSLSFWLRIARGAKRHFPNGEDSILFRQCCARVVGHNVPDGRWYNSAVLALSIDQPLVAARSQPLTENISERHDNSPTARVLDSSATRENIISTSRNKAHDTIGIVLSRFSKVHYAWFAILAIRLYLTQTSDNAKWFANYTVVYITAMYLGSALKHIILFVRKLARNNTPTISSANCSSEERANRRYQIWKEKHEAKYAQKKYSISRQ